MKLRMMNIEYINNFFFNIISLKNLKMVSCLLKKL